MVAVRCKAGTITARTTTGTTGHTGIGFQPKMVMFFCNDDTADSAGTANSLHAHGAASSATEGSWQSFYSLDAAATSDTRSAHATDATSGKCIGFTRETSSLAFEAELDSMDSDGFTLNYTTVDGVARNIHYFAIDGDNLTTKVAAFDTPTSTGSTAYTGLGFQPDGLIILFNRISAGSQSDTVHPMIGTGYATNGVSVASIAGSRDAQATASTRRFSSTSACLLGYNSTGGSISFTASLVSLDADGFTLDFTATEATAREFMVIAIKGCDLLAGSYTYKTTTGDKFVTTGINVKGLVNSGVAAPTGGFSKEIYCSGATSGPADRWAIGADDHESGTPMQADQYSDTDETFVVRQTSTLAILAEADVTYFKNNGFNMNFTTTTGNPDLIYYMAFGSGGSLDPIRSGLIPVAR